MNKSVREAIEKAAYEWCDSLELQHNSWDADCFQIGGEFGFNLALQHASVLRGALEFYSNKDHWTIEYTEGSYGDYGDKAREALEQFDKLVGKE